MSGDVDIYQLKHKFLHFLAFTNPLASERLRDITLTALVP